MDSVQPPKLVEAAILQQLVAVLGDSAARPVKHIAFRGVRFAHAAIVMSALPPPSAPQFCWLPLQDLRSTAFRYLLQHGVPGPTWGDREFLPTARRPGRTRQGGASPQLLTRAGKS